MGAVAAWSLTVNHLLRNATYCVDGLISVGGKEKLQTQHSEKFISCYDSI